MVRSVSHDRGERKRSSAPFFIVGSVRSGTTMLRNFLRLHPRLECPEETHFFRWSDPFASYRYDLNYYDEIVFDEHRRLDGIRDQDFFQALQSSGSKKELTDWYAQTYLRAQNNPEGRWFDKTPQNVYGILLINEAYPEAQFIHIHRNPLNVVASLKEGKVMPEQPLRAAISAWVESMMILNQFRQLAPDKLFEIGYERVTAQPEPCLRECLEFIGEDADAIAYDQITTYDTKDKYKTVLTADEVRQVLEKTEPYLSRYGYSL